jgi:hypothetical protein
MPRYEGMTGLVVLGFALMVIGGLISATCTLGGVVNFARWGDSSLLAVAVLGYTTLFAGMLIIGGVAVYGLWRHRKRFEGPQRTIENAYVLACTAVDKQTGEHVYYWRDYPDPLNYYVRLMEPNGKQNEYETAREVFETVMEGARGTAVCQGQWLCSFQAHRGVSTPHIGTYDGGDS